MLKIVSIDLDNRKVHNEHYFIDERGNRRLFRSECRPPSSSLDSDPVARARIELEMERQRRVLEAHVAGGF